MQYYKILNIILFLLLNSFNLEAQSSAEIFTNYTTKDTIDYGIVLYNKTKAVVFTIKNTGTEPIKLRDLKPSYSIETTGLKNHLNDHEEFRSNFSGISVINPHDSIEIIVTYFAEKDTSNYKFGYKIAKFILGVYDANYPDSLPPPIDTNNYITYREFYLTSYKVKDSLSFAESTIDLNPVYINPKTPYTYPIKFQNMSNDTIKILKGYQLFKTPYIEGELTFQDTPNLIIPPNSSFLNLYVNYSPKDTIKDTSIIAIVYQMQSFQDTIFTEIRAYPVFQRIAVFGTDSAEYLSQDDYTYIDTVFIGRTRVNNSIKSHLYLINKGNIEFSAIDQQIFDGYSENNTSNVFLIINKFPENNKLQPSKIDSNLLIQFTPNAIGQFIARIMLKSDIFSRNILHIPRNKEYETIILKGIGLSSLLTTDHDTIDFGIISSNPNCNASRTFTLLIKNSGNENLSIKKITITPPFEISDLHLISKELIPDQVDSIKIIFTDTTISKFSGYIEFITNSIPPYDTIRLPLKAERVPLSIINFSIPDNIRIKPGNKVSIPLIVDGEQIIKAKSIKCEITFERTLLKYHDFDKIRTASQNTDNNDISIIESPNGGKIDLSIHTPGYSEYFTKSDTLINLIFDTFIGNKISTPLSLINPKFGNEICEEILIPQVKNGFFTIDSICGLTEKLVSSSSLPFFISDFQPNPSNEYAYLNYQIKSEIMLNMTLFNQIGDNIITLHNGLIQPGLYEISLDTSNLSTGVYYIQFKTGYLTIRKKLIVTK